MLERVLRALFTLDDIPAPEVAPESDGWSLDWLTRGANVSISVQDDGKLPYAWTCGDRHGHGVADIEDMQSLRLLNTYILMVTAPDKEGGGG